MAILGGLSIFGSLVMIGQQSSFPFEGLACFLMLPTMIAIVLLFFMGGIAPNTVRRNLTKRQRDLLDK